MPLDLPDFMTEIVKMYIFHYFTHALTGNMGILSTRVIYDEEYYITK